MFYESMTLPTG